MTTSVCRDGCPAGEPVDFWSNLFSTTGFVPRWECGDWSTAHGAASISAGLVTFVAFVAIPIALGTLLRRRKDVPFRWVFRLFQAFILLCGLTHLSNNLMFYWPAYRLDTVLKVVAAAFAAVAALVLIPALPRILRLKSPEDLEAVIRVKDHLEKELRHANRDLQNQVILRHAAERETAIMRSLGSAKNQKEVDLAVDKIEDLLADLRATIPERYQNLPVPPRNEAETKVSTPL